MPFEIVRRSRCTEAAEIVRTGECSTGKCSQMSLDQRTVAEIAAAQETVEAFPNHVQWLVYLAQVQPDARVSLSKARQAW